jgi:hypothetical protein
MKRILPSAAPMAARGRRASSASESSGDEERIALV